MRRNSFRFSIWAVALLFLMQCTPISLNAPFASDPNQRQEFIRSTTIGTTTFGQLVARWGNPTGGNIIIDGPYEGGDDWSWAGGRGASIGGVSIEVDRSDIVRSVRTYSWVNGQVVADDFSGNAPNQPTAAPVAAGAQSGTVTPALFRQMSAFAATRPTQQAFFARFGNPIRTRGTLGMAERLERMVQPLDRGNSVAAYYYGWAPEQLMTEFINDNNCNRPHYIAIGTNGGVISSVASNMPGLGIC